MSNRKIGLKLDGAPSFMITLLQYIDFSMLYLIYKLLIMKEAGLSKYSITLGML